MRCVALALLLLSFAPSVIAQQPVNGCARQCEPKASDVNSPPVVEWGGTVNVILYGHLENVLADGHLNTLPPDPSFEKDLDAGWPVPAINTNTGVPPADLHFRNNWFVFRHCPGTIAPRGTGWEHGCHLGNLGDEVVFGGRELPVYFYVSPGGSPLQPQVGIAPNVHIYARMLTGRHSGDLLADTRSPTAATLITRPGQPDVFELRALMQVLGNAIPIPAEPDSQSSGFRVEVALYQHRDRTLEFQQNFRVRTGPQFPPRIIIPVVDPISFTKDQMRTVNGTIEYSFWVSADFGSYDVDRASASARLHARGVDLTRHLSGPDVNPHHIRDHDGASRPVKFTYTVDAKAIRTSGPLVLDFSVANRQGTYIMHHATELPFGNFDGKAVPGVPLTGILLFVGLLSILRRRVQEQ